MSNFEMVITSRQRDIGGFMVRRLLPYGKRRMVGPFVFFDHMGPAEFAPGQGMDVRPHPHIGLATVTYLFDGKIHHRDSLGSDQLIEPGAINWMTAGHGIVHSERTPADLRASGGRTHGIQLWVALPNEFEEVSPSFIHHPASDFPEFENDGGGKVRLLLGSALGKTSPVKVHSPMFYLEVKLKRGSKFFMPTQGMECAIYVVEGQISSQGASLGASEMGVLKDKGDVQLEALQDTRLALVGGEPIGERFIDWNFVSSSKERIAEVRQEWSTFGPRKESTRFKPVPGDDKEHIPL